MQDAVRKGRRGNMFHGERPPTKLSTLQAKGIHHLAVEKCFSASQIARMFDVSKSTVLDILNLKYHPEARWP